MDVFEKQFVVEKQHLDSLMHVNNVQYVQWVQDMAEAHWMKRSSNEINNQFFWVLLDHHIHYKGQAVLGDQLVAKTYVEKSEGVISHRKVEFYKNPETLICYSETQWCLISKTTLKPNRIKEEIKTLFR